MSILQNTGQDNTITEGWRALELFTDRREIIRLFTEYLNDDPPRKRILFFHGDGGNGKSLLLRFLRTHYCKRLRSSDNWEYVKTAQDEEFSAHIEKAEDAQPVPSALIDFGIPLGDDRPQEAFSALLMLRRELAGHGIRFPFYDFACIWYLHKTGKLTDEKLKSLFPAEEMDFIAEILNAITKTSWAVPATVVLNLFSKHSREQFTVYKQRRNLDEEQVEELQRMDPKSELMDKMPYLFAEDLNAAMANDGAPKRVVLFFDTHEAFWGSKERDLSGDRFFYRDEWLRLLLGTLELPAGIVAVVAGRDHPRWAEASKIKLTEEHLDIHYIGHLTEADAAQYLERAGVDDPDMRRCLVAYAQVAPDEVHPLYLGLCADIAIAASDKGTPLTPRDFRNVPQAADKGKGLMDRLLRYVDEDMGYAVRALSACRAFDSEIYFKLGNALRFHATEAAFQMLVRFSFVWGTAKHGEGWYRIHDLIRRLTRERSDDIGRRADAVLEQHYREHSKAFETAAVTEAIYHANRLDWERGVKEWATVFDNALQLSRYGLCGALLEMRNELSVKSEVERGRISKSEADYLATLARYDEAGQEYLEAVTAYDNALRGAPDDFVIHNDKGLALAKLGDLQTELSQHEEAIESYRMSIAACNEALRRAPDDADSHNNKGWALSSLGDVQATLSQDNQAIESYRQAIAAYDEAVRRAPDYIDAYINMGNTLESIGDLQGSLSQDIDAAQSYRQAIAICDKALQRAPDHVDAKNNKGYALASLGELQAKLSRHMDALESYRQAIEVYEEVLRPAPDNVVVQMNKAQALVSLGDLEANLSQHSGAVENYRQAIAACDEALRRAPDYVGAHNIRGLTLTSLGDLQAGLSQYWEAAESYKQAIAIYDQVLQLAPGDVTAHNNRGWTLTGLGDLQADLSQYWEAAESYKQAITACNEILARAPDDVNAQNTKAYTFSSLGDLQTDLWQQGDAVESYRQAIAIYGEILHHACDDVVVHSNKADALAGLGDLQIDMARNEEAIESYRQAIAACGEGLRRAPDCIYGHIIKGYVLRGLGGLQVELSQHEEATESYRQSTDACNEALRRAPDDVEARNNTGWALASLGDLQARRLQHDEAVESVTKAIIIYDEALQLAPNHVDTHKNKGNALRSLGKLQAELSKQKEAMESLQAAMTEFSRAIEIAPDNRRIRDLRDSVQHDIGHLSGVTDQTTARGID